MEMMAAIPMVALSPNVTGRGFVSFSTVAITALDLVVVVFVVVVVLIAVIVV